MSCEVVLHNAHEVVLGQSLRLSLPNLAGPEQPTQPEQHALGIVIDVGREGLQHVIHGGWQPHVHHHFDQEPRFAVETSSLIVRQSFFLLGTLRVSPRGKLKFKRRSPQDRA